MESIPFFLTRIIIKTLQWGNGGFILIKNVLQKRHRLPAPFMSVSKRSLTHKIFFTILIV